MGKMVRVKENLLFIIITHSLKVITMSISLLTMKYIVMSIVMWKHIIATCTIPITSFLWGSSNETGFLLPSLSFLSFHFLFQMKLFKCKSLALKVLITIYI